MDDQERKLFNALRELVQQVENSNARDDHGHPLKNLKALRDARAIVDEAQAHGRMKPTLKGLPVNDDPALESEADSLTGARTERGRPR
jgi:hypothetical protein